MSPIETHIADNVRRLEAWRKVTGQAKYCDDLNRPDQLVAKLITSPHAHALIKRIDSSAALAMPGMLAVVTGADCPNKTGALIADRTPLALDRVRYAGEPVAMVVAHSEAIADAALAKLLVDYQPLPHVLTPSEALAEGAPILHEALGSYKCETNIQPIQGTNIVSTNRVRKGDAEARLPQCEVRVSRSFYLPPSDHLAMEVRTAQAHIDRDGYVHILSSTQSPYAVQEQVAQCFDIPEGKVRVQVPFVGGAFGGKAPVLLEHLAYMASRAVGGRPVRVLLTREQDMAAMPCRLALEADVMLGATRDGLLQAAIIAYRVDSGAYADIAPNMAAAMAASGTGPYHIENLSMDVQCVYTNHTFSTSFRGFGHESYLFCVERAMDALANACGINPLDIRLRNAIEPGQLTPTQVVSTRSNTGNLEACLRKVQALSNWDEGQRIVLNDRTVRARGMACLWKTANPPTDAISGAVLTFNADGSVNIGVGVVEMGDGTQTRLAQLLADALNMPIGMVHVSQDIDTRAQPKHWKSVASIGEYLAGHAVLRAASDAAAQIAAIAAQALHCVPEDVGIGNAKAFKRSNPDEFFHFRQLVHGYKAPDGSSIGEPVIGRGGFMFKGLSEMQPDTGMGRPGPSWTVGAQVVEVELDTVDYTYRLISASSVIDIGALVGPQLTTAIVMGGMSMGLSLASRESFHYDADGHMSTPNLRTYKLLHIGQEPDYRVDYVTTPQLDAPRGTRSFAEHGILGMPAALANALCTALGHEINTLPITAEVIAKAAGRLE